MRFLTLAVLVLSLAALPALAQQGNPDPNAQPGAKANSGRIFGSKTCSQRIPCPDATQLSSAEYITAASTCIQQSFGFDVTNVLDDSGLDSDNCLKLKPEVLAEGKGTLPRCCVAPLPDNTCSFHCDFITGH